MPPIFWTQKQDIGPSARTSAGVAYDAARQRLLVFGGDPGGPPLADTWQWDGNLWTQVADTGPSGRQGHAMADYAAGQKVVLFGGAAGAGLHGDTWTWDGSEWMQVADTGPAARAGHALAYDSVRQRVVLFGGASTGMLGDTWTFDGTEWTQVQDTGPSARRGHAMAFDSVLGKVLLFGGAGVNGTGQGDTWAWDGATWSQVADTGPEGRIGAGLVGTSTMLLFGGVNSVDPTLAPTSRVLYGDSWRWNGATWTKVQDIGPAPRYGHGMAFRSHAGRIVLFGGASAFEAAENAALAPGLRNDTWEVPDTAAQSGDEPLAGDGTGDVLSVEVSPTSAGVGDQVLVTVTFNGPPQAGTGLVVAIFAEVNNDWVQQEPPGFMIPTVTLDGAQTTVAFAIWRDGTPLSPGQYAVAVGTSPTAMQATALMVTS